MGSKRTVRGSEKVAAALAVEPGEDDVGSSESELDDEMFLEDGSVEDDSDALEDSDDGGDEEREPDETGLAGLDAIIAASRKHANGAAAAADASDGDEDEEDGAEGAPGDEPALSEAQLKERRRSGRLSSSSLLLDEAFLADAGSDSSEDERPDRNTIGNVPLEWYNEEEHIGYDREGDKLIKRSRADKLDALLARNDNQSLALRTIYDPYNDEELVLSREELKVLMNIQKGRLPEVHINPYEDMVDWYAGEVDPFPMQNAPEPKRRFMPSKWEEKKIVKLIRAIRRGWIKPREERDPDQPPPVYMLWGDDGLAGDAAKTGAGLSYIPPPKPALPGHEESYNPPAEFLPSEEQRAAYDLLDDEDKPAFVPTAFDCLRHVPQYAKFMHERFERCLDLYLCPRVRSKRVNLKPEDLLPKALPKPADLRPFPHRLCVTYEGHRSKVRSVSIDCTGQWLLTGSDDGTMRMWEVVTGRCQKVWDLGSKVHRVAWCPNPALRLASCVCENKVVLFASGLGGAEAVQATAAALAAKDSTLDGEGKVLARWLPRDDGGLEIVHNHQLRALAWHGRGDYFAAVAPNGATQAVAVHQLSRHNSQNPFRKNRGRITCTAFHPSKPFFLVATQNNVRVYNLAKQTLAKKLLAGGGVITSLAVHPSGDHVIMGTEDKRCLWFDLDLSSKPYKIMKYHEHAVRGVAFHPRYPLFATASDDASAQVFHGMVYQDLMTNPLIVPVKILRGHSIHDFTGVLDVTFHPNQPWVVTAGGDGKACLFVD